MKDASPTAEAPTAPPAATAEPRTAARISTAVQARYYTDETIRSYFLDPDVKGHQINVDTNRGVVTLRGYVDTAEQKTQAKQIAREIEGVRRVTNRLTIGARRE